METRSFTTSTCILHLGGSPQCLQNAGFTPITMPTVQDNDTPEVETNQESPTVEDNAPRELKDEDVTSHPLYQEMEKKYKDARTGLDTKAKELKRLKKLEEALKDDSEEVETAKDDMTTNDYEDYVDWRTDHADDIKMAGEEFEKQLNELKELGVKPDLKARKKALDLALAKKGVKESVQSVSQGTDTVDRESDEHIPEEKLKELEAWGISKETYLANKDVVERR